MRATSVITTTAAARRWPALRAPLDHFSSTIFVELAALAAVLVVAALLRLPGLEQTPPALTLDESVNGLAILEIFDGYRQPFFPSSEGGREGGFIYLQASSVLLFGQSIWSLRIVSAIVGILTVAATWALGRAWFGRAVGLLSAGVLATLPWHVIQSRFGLRTIMAPLMFAVVLVLFWRLLRHGRTLDALLTGVAVGFAVQTYLSTRLIPPLLVAILLAEAAFDRSLLRDRPRALLVATVVSLIVFSPLGLYYLRHPGDAFDRVNGVYTAGGVDSATGETMVLGSSLLRTLGMFNVHGDDNWRHNIAGRPVFDPVTGTLFLAGLVCSIVRLRQGVVERAPFLVSLPAGRTRPGRTEHQLRPYLWLLLASAIMLAPTAFAIESPHFLRSTILLPMVTILPAIGAIELWRLGERLSRARTRRMFSPSVGLGAGVTIVAALGVAAGIDYWGQWATAPETWRAVNGVVTLPLAALKQHTAAGGDPAAVVLTGETPLGGLRFLFPPSASARWIDPATSVFPLFAPPGMDQVVLATDLATYSIPQEYFPEVGLPAVTMAPDGKPAMFRTDVPASLVERRLATMMPNAGDFYDARLIGAALEAESVAAGEPITVDLLWEVDRGGPRNFAPSVALVDDAGGRWADVDRQGIAGGGWRDGDRFLSRHVLQVPADAPPGRYRVQATLASRTLNQPSRVIEALGKPVEIGVVMIGPPGPGAPEPPPIGQPDGRSLAPGLVLDQVGTLPTTVRAGDELTVVVRWWATSYPGTSLDLVVDRQPLAGAGSVAEADSGAGSARWRRERYVVHIPPSAGSANATLIVRPRGETSSPGLALGVIHVEGRARTMMPIAMPRVAVATFGDAIQLHGFDLNQTCDGGRRVSVRFQWRALREMATAHTVFVHLVGPDGRIVAQRDLQPARGAYPTTAWLGGEYVVDAIEVPVPADAAGTDVRVIAGWYDVPTGQRLAVEPAASDDDFVALVERLAGC